MPSRLAQRIVALVLAEAGVRSNAKVRELAAENVDALLPPSDAEGELRAAATVVLKWMDWWLDNELCECAMDTATFAERLSDAEKLINYAQF